MNFSPSKNSIFDLNDAYGIIEVSGEAAQSFLQGQLTVDITKVTASKVSLGAYCNVKGRIRALIRIFLYQENYYLQLPKLLLPKILICLNQYAKFSKIRLTDVSQAWQSIGIVAGEELQTALSTLNFPFLLFYFPPVGIYPRVTLFTLSSFGDSLRKALLNQAQMASFESWKLLDIRASIPEVWPETSEQLFPHYLNLPQLGAVSFEKGCYCGQEIIARMEYRATTLKRHLFRAYIATLKEPPVPGAIIWADKEGREKIGTLISISQASNPIEILIEALVPLVEENPELFIQIDDNMVNVKII